MSSSSNSLTCNSNGDGIKTINNFDFSNMSITVEISSAADNMEFGIETSSNHYYFMKKQGGVVVSYEQLSGGSALGLWNATYQKFLKIENQKGTGYNRVHFWTSANGSSWTGVGVRNLTGSNTAKLVYKCGPNSTTITNVNVDGVQQDLSFGGGTPPPPPPGGNTLQAENGSISGGQIKTVHPGWTGTGFMDFQSWTGSVTWNNLSIPAGDYDVIARFGNGASRKVNLRINGSVVKQLPLTVQGAANWAQWVTETHSITAAQTITSVSITADNLSSGPNLDSIEFVSVGGSGTSPYASHGIPGKIQFENYDNGGQGLAYSDTDSGNSGGAMRTAEGIDIESTSDAGGGHNVGWTAANEWMVYTLNSSVAAGDYDLKVRQAGNGGSIRVLIGTHVLATMNLPATGGWQNWQDATATVTIPAGQGNQLKVELLSGGLNLNWIEFISGGSQGGGGSGNWVDTTVEPFDITDYSPEIQTIKGYVDSYISTSQNANTKMVMTYPWATTFYIGGTYRADTYDNSLAAIYYTMTGQAAKAKEVLLPFYNKYDAGENLLAQRFRVDNGVADPAPEGALAYDLGNNGWMAGLIQVSF